MSNVNIHTVRGAIALSARAAEYVGHTLGEGTIDLCRGAFGALGLDDEATRWAYRAERVRELSQARMDALGPATSFADLIAEDNAEAAAIRAKLDVAIADAAEAWAPLADVIEQCRAAVAANVATR